MLKLQAIENYLNSGSAYFFLTLNNGDCAKEAGSHPIMEKCPSYWAKTITEFSLLKLRESKLSKRLIIYGSVNPKIITWSDPEDSANINSVCIKSLSVFNLQE